MVKKLLRPIVNRIARLLGVQQVQQRIDSLERVVHEPSLNPALFDLLERRIVDLAMARSIVFYESITESISFVKQALSDTEERLVHADLLLKQLLVDAEERIVHLNKVTRLEIQNRLISLNENLVAYNVWNYWG